MLRQLALKQLTRAVVKGSAPSTAAKYSLPIAQTRFINNLADEKLTIPTDKEQQGGRRKEEIDAEAVGKVAFNRDPIIPADERGTKEHPILVSRCFWLVFYLFFFLYFCCACRSCCWRCCIEVRKCLFLYYSSYYVRSHRSATAVLLPSLLH